LKFEPIKEVDHQMLVVKTSSAIVGGEGLMYLTNGVTNETQPQMGLLVSIQLVADGPYLIDFSWIKGLEPHLYRMANESPFNESKVYKCFHTLKSQFNEFIKFPYIEYLISSIYRIV